MQLTLGCSGLGGRCVFGRSEGRCRVRPQPGHGVQQQLRLRRRAVQRGPEEVQEDGVGQQGPAEQPADAHQRVWPEPIRVEQRWPPDAGNRDAEREERRRQPILFVRRHRLRRFFGRLHYCGFVDSPAYPIDV
jgi:hypothetical protein